MPRSPEADLGFAFTERDDPSTRARIEADLRRIVDTVVAADRRLHALVLTGGFSRGEGTVRDGRPVNDYDVIAVRRGAGQNGLYRDLSHRLTSELGIEVDLLPIARTRLHHVGRKLFWLDVRMGGRVVWGDDVKRLLPKFGPADLPRRELARLLGNRAAGLLLAVPSRSDPQPIAQRDLQATKAAIAAMDAQLLAEGHYAARLRNRLALSEGHPDHATFARAVEWKLGGDAPDLGARWWREARDALLRAVETTGARGVADGPAEHAIAALHRHPRLHPSRAVRERAWDLLERCDWPRGPPGWDEIKAEFFRERELTLQ